MCSITKRVVSCAAILLVLMKRPDLQRLIELQRFLLAFSRIERRAHRLHGETYINETDTEHSYNLAMTAWFLAPQFPELDRDLLIRYALVHDLVEVHAGDTDIFAPDDIIATKHDRETAAAKQLNDDWVDFPDMHDLIERYENRADAEGRFIYALDKIMPIMLIYINNGYSWSVNTITLDKLHAAKADKVALSPEIKPYYDELYDLLLQSPELIAPRAST